MSISAIIIVCICLSIVAPFVWWYLYLFKVQQLKDIPGPKPIPVIGNVFDIGNTPRALLENLFKFSKKYEGLFKMFIGPDVRVVLATPQLAAPLMTTNINITKSDGYNLMKPWLGEGLLISTDDKWRVRRKLLTPTFHFKILDEFVTIFNKNSDILVQKLLNEVDKPFVDLKPYIGGYALDSICETAMGLEINTQRNQNQEYVKAVRQHLDIFMIRFFSFWKGSPFLFKLTPGFKIFKSSLKTLHTFSKSVIKTRQQELENYLNEPTDNQYGIKEKNVLLDLLLKQKESMHLTNEDIREEIDTFMFEGHDTVTAGIAFTLYLLANHADIQSNVYDEILSILGTEDQDLTTSQIQDLTYIDRVIKEALRVYPPVPMFERKLTEDVEIEGHMFPKGITVNIFVYGMHHSEKTYPDPEKFDPDRFLPKNVRNRHKFAHLPFSAGARNCIGQKYAMLQMKLTIAKVIRKFRLLPVPDFVPILGMSAILQSYNGIPVQLQKREAYTYL